MLNEGQFHKVVLHEGGPHQLRQESTESNSKHPTLCLWVCGYACVHEHIGGKGSLNGDGRGGVTAPLVHLLLELLAELVYPLLQPLPALLRGQVAEVLQGRSLEERERGESAQHSPL